MVRLPLNQIGSLGKLNKIFAKFEQEYERPPTNADLAEILDLPDRKIKDIISNNTRTMSLDIPLDAENPGEGSLLDTVESKEFQKPDSALFIESLKTEIARAFAMITQRESTILKMFFGLDGKEYTLEEI
jgi:RNA polymerase primary sigma factor